MEFKKYTKDTSYSYVFGAFGTIELLQNQLKHCIAIIVDPSFIKNEAYEKIKTIAKDIPILVDKTLISKIRDKGNIFVIGVFKKYESSITSNKHVILYKINDEGSIGTVIRSMNGFNFKDLILIDCNVDLFHEHLIRSSMGAFFQINIQCYPSFKEYLKDYPKQQVYFINSKRGEIYQSDLLPRNCYSLLFSKEEFERGFLEKELLIEKDISLDHFVNIVLFSLYQG